MTDFKNFNAVKFNNIKTKGLYELFVKPLELIVNVSFSIVPVINPSLSTQDFYKKIKQQLSLFSIDRSIKTLNLESWKYDGSRYTYGHDYTQVKLNRISSLGIDLYFIQTDLKTNIESFFKSVAKEIANFKIFQNSEYYAIRSNRNAKN